MPAVSLIVHLDAGREKARRCLEALAGLADEPSFEAVVVEDACRSIDLDGSAAEARRRLDAIGVLRAAAAEIG